MMNNMVRHSISAAALMTLSAMAGAQVLEEVEIRREGNDAVAVIKFATPVQFRSVVSARAGDLTQVFYDLVPLTELPGLVGAARRVPGRGGLPQIDVQDEVVGRAGMSRKLVINFGVPTKFRARAGRNNRHIEIVLEGMGEAATRSFEPVPKAPPAAPVPTTQAPAMDPGASAPAEVNARAEALLVAAQTAFDNADYAGTVERLNAVLALPPNASSRKAQELMGMARLRSGDSTRARAELELFLKLYPEGADSERVRQALASLPAAAKAPAGEAGRGGDISLERVGFCVLLRWAVQSAQPGVSGFTDQRAAANHE